MDPRLFLPLQLGWSSTAEQYFVDARSAMIPSRLASQMQYFLPVPYHQHHHQQQQHHWDGLWNSPTAASHHRKLFSVDSILNHGSDTCRADYQSFSRLETSDVSGINCDGIILWL